jgi:ribonuclease P protein component
MPMRTDAAPGSSTDGVPSAAQDARFPKALRLRKRPEFLQVQQHGKRFSTRVVTIIATPSAVGWTRIGVTVSKKVGKAPARNQVKRWIREAFRQHRSSWPEGVDFVVIARKGAAEASYEEILRALQKWARSFAGFSESQRAENLGDPA